MADQRILHTEKMVGAGHPSLSDTLNRLALVEHNNDGTHNKLTKVTDPWVDVRAYGAVGDGTTDDTTAIQNALTAATGKTLLFPVGTYIHSVLLTLPSNITIWAYGATIKAANSLTKTIGGLSATSKTNIHIFGLTYDGNRATRAPGTPVGSAHGLLFYGVTDSTFTDVTSKNCMADGVYIDASDNTNANSRSKNLYFYNVKADNCYRNNWSVISGKHIRGYSCAGTNATGTAPQAGIDFESDGKSGPVLGITNANPAVVNSTAEAVATVSNGDAVTFEQVIGMNELNGNTYTVANKGASTFELSGIDSTAYGVWASQGRWIRTTGGTGNSVCYPEDVQFIGSDFSGNAGDGVDFSRNALDCYIIGGSVKSNTGAGVNMVEPTSHRCGVRDTVIASNGDDNIILKGSGHHLSGFTSISPTLKHIDFDSNSMDCTLTSFTATGGAEGVYVRGTSHMLENFKVKGCTSNTADHLYTAGTGHTIQGFEITGKGSTGAFGFEETSTSSYVANGSVTGCQNFTGSRQVKLSCLHRFIDNVWDGSQGTDAKNYEQALDNTGTPSVKGMSYFVTGGTTTITDLLDGVGGRTVYIRSAHAVTINHNANIALNGAANFVMSSGDYLTLVRHASKWRESGRADI